MLTTIERLKNIHRHAMTGEDADGLKRELDSWISDGAEVSDLTNVLDGSPWRYIVTGSGSHVAIARIDELMSAHQASFDLLRAEAEALKVQDLKSTTDEEGIVQVKTRMKVARIANAHCIGAIRVRRFLLPEEAAAIDQEHDIDRLLEAHGFQWNGGDMVTEIWSKDHQEVHERSMAELRQRGAATTILWEEHINA